MIIRELLTRFGIDYDNTGFKKADRAVNTLKGKVSSMGTAANAAFGSLTRLFAGFAGIYGAKRLIEMGSAANETLNVLNEVFKQNSQAVQEWARAYARDVGRSEYEMRELAGTIGSVVSPMMDQNVEATTEMSKNLAQLAVDLGSFYNVADTDVLVALRSAISGEAEPMKRFGVVLLDATVQAFALEKGIRKSYKTMSIAEKTALRYQFILEKTKQAQGDAKRTSDGYANAIKGVQGALKDMAIVMMSRVMPWISRFTSYVRDNVIPVLQDVLGKSNIVMSALIVLGSALLLAWAPTLIPMLAVAGALGAIILLVDELITMFKGGKTVIGKALDEMFGPGTTQAIVDNVKTGWSIIIEETNRLYDSITEGAGTTSGVLSVFFDDWSAGFKDIQDWISSTIKKFEEFTGASEGMVDNLISIFKKLMEAVPILRPVIQAYDVAKEILPSSEQRKEVSERKYAAGRGVNMRLLKGPSFGQANKETLADVQAKKKKQEELTREIKAGTAGRALKSPVVQKQTVQTPQVMRGPITNRTQNNNVKQELNVTNHLTVPEGTSPNKIAEQIGRATLKAVANHPKDIVSALRQGS